MRPLISPGLADAWRRVRDQGATRWADRAGGGGVPGWHRPWWEWFRWLPAAVLLAGAVVGFVLPAWISAFPLLAAAPAIAAPLLSLTGTLATGGCALLIGIVEFRLHGREFETAYAVGFTSIVLLTVVAAAINRVAASDRRKLSTARELAEAVQRAVLPEPPPRVGGAAVAARYQAASREAAVGGDFYAIHHTPYGLRILIGDVRGKGLDAVRTVNGLLGAFQAASTHLRDLREVVGRLEERAEGLGADDGGAMSESFATAVVAELDDGLDVLRVANRGHPAPLLVSGGRVRTLAPGAASLPLGLATVGDFGVPVDAYRMPPGATLVLYTDGVTEARDRNGTFYDPVPRLSRPTPPGPDGVLDAIREDLQRHTGGSLRDDVALLAVSRPPPEAPGTAAGEGVVPERLG
ncbi:PP2C family protein-serine/threonine phosphatase [Streptomyces sp. Ru87]|uniref:PP2C family protein-serine/threonine phosphatase n=1 Tax=Streptomyces sp. Ru87 TaxID=2044307 RepID=UPI000BF44681|nr:PP2C family protein-serine/threonine phosphatase [Streptomyces sp. Ru87]PGH47084.1 hypothetical protein CRI70_30450 [Streptomyces sp. Ru87]